MAKHNALPKMTDLQETAKDMSGQVRDEIQDYLRPLQREFKTMRKNYSKQLRQMDRRVRKQPYAFLAGAFGIGAVLGGIAAAVSCGAFKSRA